MRIELRAETPTATQLYQVFRGQIERELDSVNQRTIWNVISQSFFFSAYAVTLNAPKDPRSAFYASMQDVLIWLLPFAGFVAAFLMIPALAGSLVMIRRLRQQYETELADQGPWLPPVMKSMVLRGVDNLTPVVLPLAFLLMWGLILGRMI